MGRSSLDLIPSGALALLSFSDHEAWAVAAKSVDGIPLVHHRIGADVEDADGAFGGLCGLAKGGALVVRPDQHVAARFASLPASPGKTLAATLRQILSRT